MKTWIKRTLIGLLGATAIFGGLAAWAHSHHGWGWRGMSDDDLARVSSRMVDRIGGRLDLDATQKAKLSTLSDKLREQRKALVGTAGDPRAEWQALIAGPSFDRTRASALVQEKVTAVNLKSPELIAAMADFYDSLRPDQQAKVREFMARRGHHGEHDRDHGGERRGG